MAHRCAYHCTVFPGKNRSPFAPTTEQGENGPCPEGFPVRIETLFYEVWWSTDPWKNRWKEAKNPSQPFVLSTGDPTGYSLHGVRSPLTLAPVAFRFADLTTFPNRTS